MKKKLLVTGLTLALTFVLVFFVFTQSVHDQPPLVSDPIPEVKPDVQISMVAVGDNLIHGPIYKEAQARTGGEGFDFAPAYEHIVPYVVNSDLAFINQETPLGGTELGLSSYPNFNSPQELGDYLVQIGFNLISHANNHVLDKGSKGFNKTVEYWAGQHAAVMAGAYPDSAIAAETPIYTVKGVNVAFLAYTYATNGISLPASSQGVVAYIDQDKILADVAKAHELADIVIVSMHWGTEYAKAPNEEQKNLAQALADADVDIVIGHHPHVIQPVETLRQPDGGETLVYYSLGNFISSQDKPETMLGGMAAIDMTYHPDDGNLTFDSKRFIPLVTHYEGNYKNTTVIPLADYTAEEANNHGIRKKIKSFSLEYLQGLAKERIDTQYLDLATE